MSPEQAFVVAVCEALGAVAHEVFAGPLAFGFGDFEMNPAAVLEGGEFLVLNFENAAVMWTVLFSLAASCLRCSATTLLLFSFVVECKKYNW